GNRRRSLGCPARRARLGGGSPLPHLGTADKDSADVETGTGSSVDNGRRQPVVWPASKRTMILTLHEPIVLRYNQAVANRTVRRQENQPHANNTSPCTEQKHNGSRSACSRSAATGQPHASRCRRCRFIVPVAARSSATL